MSRYSGLLDDKDLRRWYDNVARGSPVTASVYLRRLGNFCTQINTPPKDLLKLTPKEIQSHILDLVTDMEKKQKAGSYIKSNLKAVKSWLSYNDIEIKLKIKIEGVQDTPTLKNERVPTIDEFRKILLAADTQQRVASVLMGHAGLRPEVLGDFNGTDGLKIEDLPELVIDRRKGEISFAKIPTIVQVRRNLSKADHQYVTFLTQEGCEYVKDYLQKRLREGDRLDGDSPIVTPKKNSGKKRPGTHITTTNVGDMIRKAIRKAGFEWRPYVLRAFFDTQLMLAESRGLILRDYRTFFMGHKGDIEHRYTLNKKLPESVIDDMRLAFKRSSQYLQTTKVEANQNEIKQLYKEQFLLASGFSKDEIEKQNLLEKPDDEFTKMIREKLLGAANHNHNRQKVVPMNEIASFINQGYEYVTSLPTGEAIIKQPS